MMGLGVDTSLELFTELQEAFDEDKECEHPFHSVTHQVKFHGGKAEWYVQTGCLECNTQSSVMPMCGTFVQYAEKVMSQCAVCLTVAPTLFLVKEKIK